MKRNTNVSRIRPAPAGDSAQTGARPSSCATAVERAAALLVHGMRESDLPISNLSAALTRMAQTLSDSGAPLFGAGREGTAAGTDIQAVREAFARDIAICIESLQFHDRLMQELAQAREVLTALLNNRLLAKVPNTSANDGRIEGSIELF